MITPRPILDSKIRAILILFALIYLQISVPIQGNSNLAFSSSADFCYKKKGPSFWAQGKLLAQDISSKIKQAPLTQKIVSHNFSAPKTFKIVKVTSKHVKGLMPWPVKGKISSGFGMRRHPVTKRKSFHYGIDIKAKRGTKIFAPTDAVVVSACRAGLLGRLVKLRTANGLILYFGHLHRLKCKRGQRVKAGQLIGTVGSSGRATGPHLHFSIKKNRRHLNPLNFLSQ